MLKKVLFLLLLFIFTQISFSQNKVLSNSAEISIITVGPGEKLYEKFGHTGIRIKDPVLNFDLIYNYGMFDFGAPNFYANFTKGKLLYKLARYPFHYFVTDYNKDKRWIKAQILNLTQAQKQQFFIHLENNAKPENAGYEYDPYFNNCATKPRDITAIILDKKLDFKNDFVTKDQSLRELMNKEIHWNTWGNLGINIALGNRLDKVATASEYMYLPDYVLEGFKHASIYIKNQPENLIKKQLTILSFDEIEPHSDFISPLLITSILMLIGLIITRKDYKQNARNKWLDFILFFISGITGLLIVFLWFFTNHSTAPNNFNFLWAFLPNLFVAFILLKNNVPKWVQRYILLLLVLLAIIPFIWISKIQLLSFCLFPLLILMVVRYTYLYKKL